MMLIIITRRFDISRRLVIEQDNLFCTFYCSCKKWRAEGLQSSEPHVYADSEFRIIIDILLCLHYWEPSITTQCFCQLGFFEKTKNLSLLHILYCIHYIFYGHTYKSFSVTRRFVPNMQYDHGNIKT